MAAKKKSKTSARKGKLYHPPKTFDDDLVGLVTLYKKSKWSFTNVDPKQLETDSGEQRSERTTHDELEAEFAEHHHTFGQRTEQRYQRFASALGAARGAFENRAAG